MMIADKLEQINILKSKVDTLKPDKDWDEASSGFK